jgi:type II secretory pathway component GspD/PulD (secretin)
VRPTVSNDRRYITLELQPTVADLLEPIPTFATTLASSFSPVIIQLPEIRLQQARTTVRIPDKGSILIGGLKRIQTVDRASETPWLAKIPILSFLFSRKGRSDEMSHLMILVRAEITDLAEQEERYMSGLGGGGMTAQPPELFQVPTPADAWNGMPCPR